MVLGEKSTILSYGGDGGAMSQLQEILTRYFGGQLSAEQMTQEMDKKLQMIYMENQ